LNNNQRFQPSGSGKSNNSHLTIESAYQRLETIESKMDSIQTILLTLKKNYQPTSTKLDHDYSSSDDSDKLQCTQLLSYDTPKNTTNQKQMLQSNYYPRLKASIQ
jgi:hypothetical protein